jgi:hypothetical protein
MTPSIKSFNATLLAGVIAASMTACSKDLPTGPGETPVTDGTQPGVILQAAPANDDFDTPVVINALPFTETISTVEATPAVDDPTPTCAAGGTGPTVWYAFTPSRRMTIEANTFGSNYDTDLVVYTGTRGNLAEVLCSDDAGGELQSSVTVEIERGQSYYFMVGAFASGPGGTLVFNLNPGRKQTSAPQFRFRDKGVEATFSSSSECVQTFAEIMASRRALKAGSVAPSQEPLAQVFIDRFDTCTGTQLNAILGSTTDGVALQVDNRLTVARLQVTIPGFDFVSETEVLVDVNLDWTGTGTLVTTSTKSREVSPGGVVITRFRGTRRDATASGTVLLSDVNLTPEPSEDAAIFDAQASELTVERDTRVSARD